MTIGERVRARRRDLGWSLGELAKQSGVSKGYLSQVESGLAPRPSAETTLKVAIALGVPMNDLLGAEENVPEGLPPSLRELGERRKDIHEQDLKMLASIRFRGQQPTDPKDWEYLYETIRRMISHK